MTKSIVSLKTINIAACYTAFLQGSSLEDIAVQYDVAEKTLKDLARSQAWHNLAITAQEHLAIQGEDKQAPEKLKLNREKNLAQAETLRDELDKTIRDVSLEGGLAIAPAVLSKLTKAASDIHDLTYRALGDKDKQRDAQQGSGSASPAITINLPGAIAQPRQKRAQDAIDVD